MHLASDNCDVHYLLTYKSMCTQTLLIMKANSATDAKIKS